ncbi:hypothetical protein J2X65_004877 [Ancylobacter sp. 3268]|uniref:hypothetical protein n=1 Tax=Ancylobacter sp. 3268 TaxID=2817752 RepID=UPI0028611C36|nr:hypothetical protein [Ancylobacter sp. 3268]MDR6955497.1 hypothetical protein [Ancylobacter sp. 3268]
MAFTSVKVPAEILAKGPTGYRIKVVDYNATEQRAYLDRQDYQDEAGALLDPFGCGPGETPEDPAYQTRLIGDPNFHAQNCYAIAMRTLGAFERALGRRVSWSSGGHQLHIAPHAFAQANAFYSEPDRALLFGYFYGEDGQPIFTCLSHDIVAHETTHALLDGLRSRFTEPSGPDQSAFHEGFADIVALLSIFSLESVVAAAIGEDGALVKGERTIRLVDAAKLEPKAMRKSILLGIARQVGEALTPNRLGEDARGALRRSVEVTPTEGKRLRRSNDEHDRGEVIVAAMMRCFIELWSERIVNLGTFEGDRYNLDAVVEEGVKVAGHLLNMAIRALDYCPPTDIDFRQFLAALLTADRELVPEDDRNYRGTLRNHFADYGIKTPAKGCDEEGCWLRFSDCARLIYARSNFAAMMRNRDEFFRFLWENREALGVNHRAYTEVVSIDMASRIGPDGLALHETVCQYVQRVDLFGAEFKSVLGAELPEGMATTDRLTAHGGGVVILDQYGQVKYHISNPVFDGERQRARAQYLMDAGLLLGPGQADRLQFGMIHLERMGG